MNNYRKILIFVILLVMLASGCSKQASPPPTPASPPPTDTATPNPTATPQPTDTPFPTNTPEPIAHIVAFWDSPSDNGASMRITKADVENKVTDAGILPPLRSILGRPLVQWSYGGRGTSPTTSGKIDGKGLLICIESNSILILPQ